MKQITSLADVILCAVGRRSLTCNILNNGKPVPAAVIQNFQGHYILNLMSHGLFIYETKMKSRYTLPGRP